MRRTGQKMILYADDALNNLLLVVFGILQFIIQHKLYVPAK